jgi:hypothetical protein
MLVDMKPIEEQLQELRERRSALDIRIQKLEALQQRRLQIRDKVRRINGVTAFPFPSAA